MIPDGSQSDELQKAERIAYLIAGHLRGTLTPEEGEELDEWICESDENLALFEKLIDEDNLEASVAQYQRIEKNKTEAFQNIKRGIKPEGKRGFPSWVFFGAASLLVIVIVSLLLINKTKPTIEEPSSHVPIQQELPAASNQAVLTLSGGRTLILDSTQKGVLANEGGITIHQNAGGLLAYTGNETAMRYNTISTPRGGQYQLVLGDGSKVWLNADSYLKFPAGFSGKQRNVELKGEAYFEVAKDAQHPFVVKLITPRGDEQTVEVLGTHFNVDGYGDEGVVRTTLLEGSVRVVLRQAQDDRSVIINPGQQAVVGEGIRVRGIEAGDAIAWTKGKFVFRDASIESIGQEISRWYDVDVLYKGGISQHFNTEADRTLPLQKLLKGLEGTGEARFMLEGRKLIIQAVPIHR